MIKQKIVMILACLMVAVGGFASDIKWERFCGKGFCATLPGHPKISQDKLDVKCNRPAILRHYVAFSDESKTAVLITYGLYPKAFFKNGNIDMLMNAIVGGLFGGENGTLLSRDLEMKKYDRAMDYVFLPSDKGVMTRARVYVLKPSIRVVAIFSQQKIPSEFAKYIFDNFRIVDIDGDV